MSEKDYAAENDYPDPDDDIEGVRLVALIKQIHEDVGDGYHDGTDHAIDSTIEALHKAGLLPQLPTDWLKQVKGY